MNREYREYQSQTVSIPEVYRLVERGANSVDLIQQLYKDFYAADHEAVLLAIHALKTKGLEGEAALRSLSTGKDAAAELVKNNSDLSIEGFEQSMGIKRFANLARINPNSKNAPLEYALTLEQYAKNRGWLKPDGHLEDLKNDEKQTTGYATFGKFEPAYLELLGPLEILRLRTLQNSNLLLLGSATHDSTVEFQNYAAKLKSTANVIEIDPDSIEDILANEKTQKSRIVQGDIMNMPFKDESFDHLYTNLLTDMLRTNGNADLSPDSNFLFQCARIIKPSGSLILFERQRTEGRPVERIMTSELRKLGFEAAGPQQGELGYIFKADNSSAKISENGIAYYENLVANAYGDEKPFAQRFVKKG